MRLEELAALIRRLSFQDMRLVAAQSNPNGLHFTNVEKFKTLIDVLKEEPLFQREVDFLLKSRLYSTTAEDLFVASKDDPTGILNTANSLITQLSGLQIILGKLVTEKRPEVNGTKISVF